MAIRAANGAVITYYQKTRHLFGKLKLEVLDEKGNVLYREKGELDFLAMRRAIVPALNRLKPWGGLSPIKP